LNDRQNENWGFIVTVDLPHIHSYFYVFSLFSIISSVLFIDLYLTARP